MVWHFVILDSLPLVIEFQTPPPESIHQHGRWFKRLAHIAADIVFYDVIVNSELCPIAIELHVAIDDQVYGALNSNGLLKKRAYIDHCPFPIIWLTDSRDGTALGLEAFGDLQLYHDRTGLPAIAFNCSSWIQSLKSRSVG